MIEYKTQFHDKLGTETSVFRSDGSELSIELRGITFSGICFETLEGDIDHSKFDYVEYENEATKGDLTNCTFEVIFPLVIVKEGNETLRRLQAMVQLGNPEKNGISLRIASEGGTISSRKRFGYFENAIIDIQNQLPKKEKIKTCLSCKHAHYNPYGNGMYGHLHCFKNIKEHSHRIQDKTSLFEVWEKAEKEGKIFNIQETYHCEFHEFICDEDWNYSNWVK